jgi:hypothetical protein
MMADSWAQGRSGQNSPGKLSSFPRKRLPILGVASPEGKICSVFVFTSKAQAKRLILLQTSTYPLNSERGGNFIPQTYPPRASVSKVRVVVSMAPCSRAMKTSRSKPGGMGGST